MTRLRRRREPMEREEPAGCRRGSHHGGSERPADGPGAAVGGRRAAAGGSRLRSPAYRPRLGPPVVGQRQRTIPSRCGQLIVEECRWTTERTRGSCRRSRSIRASTPSSTVATSPRSWARGCPFHHPEDVADLVAAVFLEGSRLRIAPEWKAVHQFGDYDRIERQVDAPLSALSSTAGGSGSPNAPERGEGTD